MAAALRLNLHLTDNQGKVKRSALIRLSPQAYAGFEFEPRSLDLAKLMDMGELVSNNLSVQLAGRDGHDQLYYTAGETVKLLVKANLPCEYFIVAHTDTPQGVYSYLLEIAALPGRINGDLCNRWVELDDFTVTEPFGGGNPPTLRLNRQPGGVPATRETGQLQPAADFRRSPGHRSVYPRAAACQKEVENAEAFLSVTTSRD